MHYNRTGSSAFSKMLQFPASLLLLSMLLFSFMACDSPPGSSPYDVSPSSFLSITLDPDRIVFDAQQSIVDTTLNITISALVQEGSYLNNPSFTVSREGTNTVFREGALQPGSAGNYTGSFSFTVPSNTFDTFTVYVFDTSEGGVLSNTLQRNLVLEGFSTLPPEIISFTFPAVVQIPETGLQPIRFETEVSHPQGQNQIQSVFLELFDSAGNRIGSEPFTMLDDGDEGGSGDLEEGDGIFTRTLEIGPNNQPDTYQVFSYAIDRQGLSSDTLSSSLIIE